MEDLPWLYKVQKVGLFRRRARRPIEDFLAFEEEMHRRLEFVELQVERVACKHGIWRRHITVVEGEFEPVGHTTAVFEMARGLRRWPRWAMVSAGSFVVAALTLTVALAFSC